MFRAPVFAVLLAAAGALHAQYPSRSITLVVPFTAGSDADLAAWSALAGPPQLPREVVERWSEALAKLAHDEAWLAGNEKLGGIPAIRSPAETEKFVREQYLLYETLADRLGLRQ